MPGLPLGREVVETCDAGAIVTGKLALATLGGCSASATVTLNEKLPDALGVPDRAPALLRLSPGGKLPDATFQV